MNEDDCPTRDPEQKLDVPCLPVGRCPPLAHAEFHSCGHDVRLLKLYFQEGREPHLIDLGDPGRHPRSGGVSVWMSELAFRQLRDKLNRMDW